MRHSIGRRLLALAGLPIAAAALSSSALTAAAWTDADYPTATLTAGQIDPPTNVDCDDDLLSSSARMTWGAPTTGLAPNGYTVVLSAEGILAPDDTMSFLVPSDQMYFDISPELVLFGDYTVTIYSTRDGWISEPATPWAVNVTAGVFGLGFASCEGRLLDPL